MANVARVEATITARNHLRPGLNSAAGDLARFRATQTRAARAISQSLTHARGLERMERAAGALRHSIGGLGVAFAAGMGLSALKQATTRFAAVDRAMARTGLTGDATVEQTRRGTEELRNMARETGMLFDPAQKGLDAITASGRDFADAMKMMPSVLRTAQASGAGVDDIANSSTALIDHMKISIEGLAEAQDTLAMGGKLGKFELRDMARYLPSMLPAYKAIGKSGQEGLRNLVAMLQVIRGGTGTAEEAAASAQNIFSKMESDQTVKNFKEMGVDLPKAMAKARKEGRDLIEVFLDLSNKALKGDLSKVPQLFKDMEVQRGMRPLLAGMQKIIELRGQLQGSVGTIDKDFLRISTDTQATLDRFGESADRAKSALGALAAEAMSPALKNGASNLDAMAQAMERAAEAARTGGLAGAVKRLAGDAATSIGNEIVAGRQSLQGAGDRLTADTLAERRSKPTRLDELTGRDPASLSRQEVAELHVLRKRGAAKHAPLTDAEMAAISRDQQRRAGGLPGAALTSESPEFDLARSDAREARRARSWTSPATLPDDKPAKSRGGQTLPPARPRNIGGPAMPAFGDDAGLVVAAQPQPTAPAALPVARGWRESIQASLADFRASLRPGLDRMKWKGVQPAGAPADTAALNAAGEKAEAVKDKVSEIGPAGQSAGSMMALGFGTGLSQMESDAAATIARIQQKLNSLRAPTLPFGGGGGGFDTGKQGPN